VGLLTTALVATCAAASAQAQQYWNTNGAAANITANNWSASPGGPFTSPYSSATNMVFGANSTINYVDSTNISNVTVSNGFTVGWTPTGTLTTGGAVRTFDVGAGAILDLSNQAISTAAGTGLVKSGAGILFMSNASAYTGGFTLNAGIMILGGTVAMGGSNSVLTINGGTLASPSTRNIPSGRFSTVNIGGDFTFGAVTTGVASGNAVAARNIRINDPVNLGAATRTITLGGSGLYTLGDVVSGAPGVGLTVTGSGGGALLLVNTNTYTGPTTISAGTLTLTGSGSIASSPTITVATGATFEVGTVVGGYSLASGQTLKGTGTFGGGASTLATFASGSKVAPGASIGTLLANGDITFASGSTLEVEFNATSSDRFQHNASNRTVTFDSGFVLSLLNLGTPTTQTAFTIASSGTNLTTPDLTTASFTVDNIGHPSGTYSTPNVTFKINPAQFAGGEKFSLSAGSGNLVLTFTPVPEPAFVTVIFAAGLGGAAWLRRSRRPKLLL
jgi:autotransporter-associated beta strand protein